MTAIEKLNTNALRSICNILGDTYSGLTGSQIARALGESGILDVEPSITKRDRIFAALSARQGKDGCSNSVLSFIKHVMDPVANIRNAGFESTLEEINQVLAFSGLELGEDGVFRKTSSVKTINEAQARASKLREKLLERKVHADVLLFCREELLQDNYFHAVFEATKSVADKIRSKAEVDDDGAPLVDKVFALGDKNQPKLAINTLQNETLQSEHKGFANLLKGFFGMFRNTTGHAPKVKWEITEEDALDILTVASFLHRKLDSSVKTGY